MPETENIQEWQKRVEELYSNKEQSMASKKSPKKAAKKVRKPAPKPPKAKTGKPAVEIPDAVSNYAAPPTPVAREEIRVENVLDYLKSLTSIPKVPGKRYTTGFKLLDQIFTGLGASGLKAGVYLIVADPGCGKSSFCLQLMNKMIQQGHPGLYLAYEGKENVQGCIQRLGLPESIPVADKDDKHLAPTSANLCNMMEKMHKANRTGKPAIITVDSVKNLNATKGGTIGRRIAIQDLCDTAPKTNTIVFLIAHVSNDTRKKKVKKIQGPAELEELCDVRIDFIDCTPKEQANLGYREIMLDVSTKNRFGRPGQFRGNFLEETGWTFAEDLAAATKRRDDDE